MGAGQCTREAASTRSARGESTADHETLPPYIRQNGSPGHSPSFGASTQVVLVTELYCITFGAHIRPAFSRRLGKGRIGFKVVY